MVKATYGVVPILTLIVMSFSSGIYAVNGQTKGQARIVSNPTPLQTCAKNPDRLYDRQQMLKKLDRVLKQANSFYKEFPEMGFFVYDLTDPSNSYQSPIGLGREKGCINFINHHVYHFSPASLASSMSQIAILEDGKLKIFRSINCAHSKEHLDDALNYVNEILKKDKNKEDTITRLKHYRRYGRYMTVDEREFICDEKEAPPNSDKLYSRREVLERFEDLLCKPKAESLKRNYACRFIENDRAVGFFIYDLTEPSNKQTSLLERIEFKNNHVYHFADIDLPFSFSNIAILEDGKVRIFKAINCEGKGDSVEDVIRYLNEKLKYVKNRDEIIERVKNYRDFGVYTSLNGVSAPQCESLSAEK